MGDGRIGDYSVRERLSSMRGQGYAQTPPHFFVAIAALYGSQIPRHPTARSCTAIGWRGTKKFEFAVFIVRYNFSGS
jgi:hypothetical protein